MFKTVRLEIVENFAVEFHFTHLNLTIFVNGEFNSCEHDRIDLHENSCIFKVFPEVLMNNIAALRHDNAGSVTQFTLPEEIHTSRLFLRRLRYEDAPEIFYAYASKPEATRYVSWPTHRRIEDTYSFITYARAAWENGNDFSYAIRLAGSNMLAGSIGVIHNDGAIQFGYIFSPAHWNNGYATEACRALLAELVKRPVTRIGTFVARENEASTRVLQKCGLIEEAFLPGWLLFPNAGPARKDCIQFRYPLARIGGEIIPAGLPGE